MGNLSEKEYDKLKNELKDELRDELKTWLSSYVQKQCFAYKSNITSEVADLLEETEKRIIEEIKSNGGK